MNERLNERTNEPTRASPSSLLRLPPNDRLRGALPLGTHVLLLLLTIALPLVTHAPLDLAEDGRGVPGILHSRAAATLEAGALKREAVKAGAEEGAVKGNVVCGRTLLLALELKALAAIASLARVEASEPAAVEKTVVVRKEREKESERARERARRGNSERKEREKRCFEGTQKSENETEKRRKGKNECSPQRARAAGEAAVPLERGIGLDDFASTALHPPTLVTAREE